jgi:hypothetical protein
MPRPVVLVLTWVAATVAAIALAWAGVSLVADQVVQPVRPSTVTEALAASPSPTPSPVVTPTPTTSATPSPGATPTATPSGSPADDGRGEAIVRTHQLVGGRVTIEYTADAVRILVPAEPADGFRAEVDRRGPTELRIEFTSETHRSRLDAWWDGGARFEIDEDERDDADDEPSESESESEDDDADDDGDDADD